MSVGPHWSNIFDDFPSYKTPYVPIGFPGHFSLEDTANNKALIERYTQLTQSETHTKRTRNAHETHRSKGPPIALTQVGSLNLFQVRFSCCFHGAKTYGRWHKVRQTNPLVMTNITMENHHRKFVNFPMKIALKMVDLSSSLCERLPEGK